MVHLLGKQMKKILKATNLVLIVSVISLTAMGRKVVDKSADSRYASLIGKEFRTTKELLIYRPQHEKELLLGDYGGGDLPHKEQMKKIPFWYYDVRILGIIPVGSVFKITKVTHEGSVEGMWVYYYADLIKSDNTEFVGKKVNPTFLADVTADPPVFYPKYVESIN